MKCSLQAARLVLRFQGGASATASSPPFLKVDTFVSPEMEFDTSQNRETKSNSPCLVSMEGKKVKGRDRNPNQRNRHADFRISVSPMALIKDCEEP
ncbi:hypothetical protein F2Q69_00043747 [Brassica cretica]|uniref:Uncharacterized protein n=1 Tax=Brassica cretica TaxID=69181 RepID=A0A8S9NP78_BRACR|nr:hypothetical protein F2Q69_00043747 [Brassica cretica]